MWIFTTYGFFSFTQSTYQPGFIQIRARDDRDLVDLKKRHKLKGKVIETDNSDYRWRLLVKPDTAARIVAAEVEAIDYSNFKNATTDRMHARPLMDVWSSMMRVQTARERELRGESRVVPRTRHEPTSRLGMLSQRLLFEHEHNQTDGEHRSQALGRGPSVEDLEDAERIYLAERRSMARRAYEWGADLEDQEIPF